MATIKINTATKWRKAIEAGRVEVLAEAVLPRAFPAGAWLRVTAPPPPALWFDTGEGGRWQASVDYGPACLTITEHSFTRAEPIARIR